MRITRRVTPGVFYTAVMPYSEVCMHMQVAGKLMMFALADNLRSVQLYDTEDKLTYTLTNGDKVAHYRKFSAPILPGEAGLYSDAAGYYFNCELTAVEAMELYSEAT